MVNINEISPTPSHEEWNVIFKQLAEVSLLKVAWINNSEGIRKFSAYKIFRIGKKHSDGKEHYNYIIIRNDKKPDEPKTVEGEKYLAIRLSDSFAVIANDKVAGSVAENYKLLESHPFSISMTSTNNKLRWAVVVHDN